MSASIRARDSFFDTEGHWRSLPTGDGFRVSLRDDHPYFSHHRVRGWKVLPGVVYLELALSAVARARPDFTTGFVDEVVWLRPVLANTPETEIDVQLASISPTRIEFRIEHGGEMCGGGVLNAQAVSGRADPLATPLCVRSQVGAETRDHFPRSEVYAAFADMGIVYGPYFQRISYVQRLSNKALSWLSNYDGVFLGWASLLDCAFQAGMAISIGERRESLMPYSLGRLTLHRALPDQALGSAFVLTEKLSPFRTNLTIFDETYTPLLSVFDLGVKPSHLQ
ncbi:polyketide synthase dehydratase domain-containing protein [Hahella sp. HN01]|uniref:polyketide synthase dehydratase domain-containing protein n=1 Tax=Hahella sp. HN01 TaxID=2847262 RepID=UPI001C1ED568|nr:polyketide synthase dehydratase domain-containing protein [Hahella sp. HN01]MBU6955048.1 polyketide synthase dehydratase domain-containing protein [Hahella sp. HN01]